MDPIKSRRVRGGEGLGLRGSVKRKDRSGRFCEGQEVQLHATYLASACKIVVMSGLLHYNLSSVCYEILLLRSGGAPLPRCLKCARKDPAILN